MQMKDKANKEQKKSSLYGKVNVQNIKNEIYTKHNNSGITLVALVITILFSYDEKLKYSNSKGFLLQTI